MKRSRITKMIIIKQTKNYRFLSDKYPMHFPVYCIEKRTFFFFWRQVYFNINKEQAAKYFEYVEQYKL